MSDAARLSMLPVSCRQPCCAAAAHVAAQLEFTGISMSWLQASGTECENGLLATANSSAVLASCLAGGNDLWDTMTSWRVPGSHAAVAALLSNWQHTFSQELLTVQCKHNGRPGTYKAWTFQPCAMVHHNNTYTLSALIVGTHPIEVVMSIASKSGVELLATRGVSRLSAAHAWSCEG
jgi:hypothetical protein